MWKNKTNSNLLHYYFYQISLRGKADAENIKSMAWCKRCKFIANALSFALGHRSDIDLSHILGIISLISSTLLIYPNMFSIKSKLHLSNVDKLSICIYKICTSPPEMNTNEYSDTIITSNFPEIHPIDTSKLQPKKFPIKFVLWVIQLSVK